MQATAEPSTWVDLLERRASERPHADLYIAPRLSTEGKPTVTRTHRDFRQRVEAIAATLQERAAQGSRVLVCLPNGIEYLEAFFGCLYAGMIAVPIYPPHPRRAQPQLESIAASSQPEIIVTDAVHRDACVWFASRSSSADAPHVLVVTETTGARWHRPDITPSSVALLQYTSGSTANPKGVTLTHANLLANQRAIAAVVGTGGHGVSWLPLFHDMGLGSALAALYCGATSVLLSPFTFAANPRSWLEAITSFRARVSAAPNFAFDHCVDRIQESELEGLDLSSWTAAIVGAEPVRARTLRAFANKFSRVGFDIRSFRPSYGMAEATLLVTSHPAARSPVTRRMSSASLEKGELAAPRAEEPSVELVSCGSALPEHHVLVVDPSTGRAAPPGKVGEIWLTGPSVSRGYWLDPAKTRETFGGRTQDADGEFLRTGDLGVLDDGELFVTGRLKDMLIVRGRNYYPQDIELAAERTSAKIVPHASAAFAIEGADGPAPAVLVCEVARRTPREQLAGLASGIRENVQDTCDLVLDAVVFVERGSSPRTTSGKVQRSRARALLLRGELPVLGHWTRDHAPLAELGDATLLEARADRYVAPDAPEEREIARVWSEVLGVPRIGIYDSFFDLGGHSMRALEILQRVNAAFGVTLQYRDLYANPTIEGMVHAVREARRSAPPSLGLDTEGTSDVRYPLTRAQLRIWEAFERRPSDTASNIMASTRIEGPLDRGALERALRHVASRHPALRTRFERDEGGRVWQQVEPRVELELAEHELSSLPLLMRGLERQRIVGAEVLRPFDLRALPLFRTLLIHHGPHEHELAFVINHIVGDGWSLSILERELHAVYRSYVAGHAPSLPEPSSTYAHYVRWLDAHTSDPERRAEAKAFWERRLRGLELAPAKLPYDRPDAFDPLDTKTSAFRTVVGEAATARIRGLAKAHGSTPFVLLFSALARWLSAELGRTDLILGIPSANRHRQELLDVFGYFVDPVVVPVRVNPGAPFGDLVSRVGHEIFASLEHAPFPIELVCEAKGVPCPGLRMFHVWYNMTTFGDMAKRPLSDREARHIPVGPDSKFDFSIYPSEYADGIEICSYYKRALYRPETIERAVLAFTRSLEELE